MLIYFQANMNNYINQIESEGRLISLYQLSFTPQNDPLNNTIIRKH